MSDSGEVQRQLYCNAPSPARAHREDSDSDDDDDDVRMVSSNPNHSSSALSVSDVSGGSANLSDRLSFDPRDNTTSLAAEGSGSTTAFLLPRIVVLPRCLIKPCATISDSCSVASTTAASSIANMALLYDHDQQRRVDQDCKAAEAAPWMTPSSSGKSSGGREGGGGGSDSPGDTMAAITPSRPSTLRHMDGAAQVAAVVVRLSHPRHGQRSLFLCPTTAADNSTHASAALYELQSQGAPNGFGQTWFIDELVLPKSDSVLVATPFDVTFMALRELLEHPAAKDKFVPATDIFRSSSGSSSSNAMHNGGGDDGGSGAGGLFSGLGEDSNEAKSELEGDEESFFTRYKQDSFQRLATAPSSSGITAVSAPPAPPQNSCVTTSECLEGWAAAVVECPSLSSVLTALQSHTVLANLCEFKLVGDTYYYKFSPQVAGHWVSRKVRRVQDSAVMRRLLQLPSEEASPSSEGDQPQQQPPSPSLSQVPLEVAFGVVADYIPEVFTSAAASACGIQQATASSARVGCAGGGLSFSSRTDDPDGAPLMKKAKLEPGSASKAAAAPPKSASVKRLEKAGRPKGTPTLFSMFAKKATEKE